MNESDTKNTLTPKQALFVQEYMIDLNATQAAIRTGYSRKTAQQIGSENLLKPVIKSAIQAKQDQIAQKLEFTAESVLKDIIRIGDEAKKAKKYGDALKSRELLGKHLKLFTDKTEHTGDITINVVRFADQPQEQLEAPEQPKRIDAEVQEVIEEPQENLTNT